MYAWFYKGSDLLSLPIVSLVLFMAVFAAVVIKALRHRDALDSSTSIAHLPLNDEHIPGAGHE